MPTPPPSRPLDESAVRRAARALDEADSILFVTGAGISADSGLPTYRGVGGLYEERRTDDGYPIEVALSGEMLASRPDVCWRAIAQIELACRGARPNRAHERIAELEREKERVWVLTQNVDGLHRSAGSENVIEIHGDVHDLVCTGCGAEERVEDYSALDVPPRCERCGALVRPVVVLFGEMLPVPALERLRHEVGRGFDLVFSIGTTSVFPYIAEPVVLARERGGFTIEINPGESGVSHHVDLHLRAGASEALEAIVGARGERSRAGRPTTGTDSGLE
ncbi:MAG: NAD-dependent deacetylase [Planctomycetota bacterium JB042]